MAINDIKKINDEINKLRAELGKTPLKFFEENDLERAKATLSGLRAEVREMGNDLDYIYKSFKDSVNELSRQNIYLSDARKALNGISDVSKNIIDYRKGETSFDEKTLQNLKKKATAQFDELQRIKDARILNNLNQGEIEKALRDQELFNNELDKTINAQKIVNKEIGLVGTGIKGISNALSKMGFGDFSQPLTEAIEKTKNARLQTILNNEEIQKNKDILEKSNNILDNRFKYKKNIVAKAEEEKKIAELNIKNFQNQNTELSTQTSKYKNIGNALKDQLTTANLIDFSIKQMVDALIKADKSTGELAKSFGTSYAEAASLRNELNTIANLSADVNINTASLQKALIELNKQFGTATMLNGELLKDYTRLTEVAGYTAEAAAELSKITVATGTDLSENTAEILGQAVAFNAVNGLALNEKEIVEGVAKASAATTLSLGMQPKELALAVAQAKALGTNLEKVEQIASSLLNFEQSISSELEAELLVGKDINLERARLFALNNDIAGVAEEIAKQIGTAADFTNMNVIQQEALAKAVGMTREDLAKSLIEREALAKIGEGDKTSLEAYNRLKKEGLSDDQIALKLGDDKLAAQLRSQSIQERFNKSVEKLQEIFVSLAEPILQIVSPFMDLATTILPLINIVLTPIFETIKAIGEGFQFVISLITGEGGFKEGLDGVYQVLSSIAAVWLGIVGIQKLLKTQLLMNLGIQTATTSGLITQFVLTMKIAAAKIAGFYAGLGPFGIPLAIATIAGLYAAVRSATSKRADDMISPGYGKRTLLAPEGAIALNDKDTVIAGTKLSRDNNSSSNNQNTSINFEPMVSLLSEIKGVLGDINKQSTTTVLEVDGQKLATAQNIRTFKIQ